MWNLALLAVAVVAGAALLFVLTRFTWRVLLIALELVAYGGVVGALGATVYACVKRMDTGAFAREAHVDAFADLMDSALGLIPSVYELVERLLGWARAAG